MSLASRAAGSVLLLHTGAVDTDVAVRFAGFQGGRRKGWVIGAVRVVLGLQAEGPAPFIAAAIAAGFRA